MIYRSSGIIDETVECNGKWSGGWRDCQHIDCLFVYGWGVLDV